MISENTTLSMNDILNSVDPKVFKNKVPLLLFQTGYLTFEQTTAKQKRYKLLFPNLDVRRPFSRLIAKFVFKGAQETEIFSIIHKLKDGDYISYFDFIASHFCKIPIQNNRIRAKNERIVLSLTFWSHQWSTCKYY